ncbi:uncharacterized protein LOC132751185 [Ruditapes philippinarum]|uniref:uncharacterized protein LOC132751185 n=1 Tax=Ruditapes philippinarum TaxID=129788 RepID=UPI00295B5A04|nr:uncharacterized protein LOC132751185 [Ruditapes philippinarum]
MRKSKLLSKVRPDDIALEKFKRAVKQLRKGLSEWADTVRKAQAKNNSVITTCRVEKKEHENEINLMCFDISKQRETINYFESEIKMFTIEASSYDNEASRLETYAAKSHKQFKTHVKVATFGSGLGLLSGFALAPFTGGLSIVGAAVGAGVNTAVNGTAAYANKSNANTCKREAETTRQKACHLRQKVSDINSDILLKEREVSEMESRQDQLERTITSIRDVEGLINNLIEVVEERLINVQDVETMLYETELTGDSLSIILRAWERDRKKGVFRKIFGRRPRHLDAEAERLKNKIQTTWYEIERSVLPSSGPSEQYLQLM